MSTMRRCDVYKATDEKFYMVLGDFEYAESDFDCTTYGPFDSSDLALEFLSKNFSNPGGYSLIKTPQNPPVKRIEGWMNFPRGVYAWHSD